jgi:hypothetical protein
METKTQKTVAALSGAHFPFLKKGRFPNVDIVDLSRTATKAQRDDAEAIAYALQILGKQSGTVSHFVIYDDGKGAAWMGWHSKDCALLETGKARTIKRSVLAVRNAFRVFGQKA